MAHSYALTAGERNSQIWEFSMFPIMIVILVYIM